MVVELVCVGTELLLGNIVNTNAAYLAERCAQLGFSCFYQAVVGDNKERLTEQLNLSLKRSDIIILCGGLGPTPDDLTKEVVAECVGKKLIMDAASQEAIEQYFANKGIVPTNNNWKQAMIPEGAIVLPNHNGTAPGIILKAGEQHLVLLPGPPAELEPMFEESVIPYLKSLEEQVISSVTVKVCGIGESKVAEQIQDMIDSQTNPTIATYAKTGEVHIRVTAKAEDEKAAHKLIKPIVKELKLRLSNYIYTTEDDVSLEKAVVDLLLANDLTVTLAESCTGGLLAARIINVPGTSEVIKSSYVTYSNKAKRKILGVKKSTLDKYSVVSKQVTEEMAQGLTKITKADVTVGITGYAGPDGGDEKVPVGTVFISCSVKGHVTTKEYHFVGNRNTIRQYAVSAALVLMRQSILEYFSKVTFGKK